MEGEMVTVEDSEHYIQEAAAQPFFFLVDRNLASADCVLEFPLRQRPVS